MNIPSWIFMAVLPIISVAFLLAFVRLLIGPTLPDRVVALDLMATIGIGFIVAYSVVTNQRIFLDVATVFALISFLATVAFAFYLKRKA